MESEFNDRFGIVFIWRDDTLRRQLMEYPGARRVHMDGHRLRDWEMFYDEIAIALGFPDYFGRNLNALIDCMRDEYYKADIPLVLWISHADDLLVEESADSLHGVLSSFTFIAEEWRAGMAGVFGEAPYPRRMLIVLEYGRV